MKKSISVLLFLVALAWTSEAPAVSRLLDVRFWSAPDHTRVVVDLEGAPSFEIPPPADPLVLKVILRQVTLGRGRGEIPVGDRVIRMMKLEPAGSAEVHLTLSLVQPARWNSFILKPYLDKPDRIVLDILRPDLEEKERVERTIGQELKSKKVHIVVLDPGHGGEDPGAIGPRRTREKDIVLALGKRVQKELDQTGEVRAFLTRRGDYFLPLQERVRIAREYGADLFISLHANGSLKRHVRGTAVYCLSLKGASDKAAQLLAQKENASDLVGGIFPPAQRKDLDSILLDLEQTQTINESLHLGGLTLTELRHLNPIQFPHPQQAGFAVLKAPGIPSILVESAYITHPIEEKFLQQESFHSGFAQALRTALKRFLPVLAVKESSAGPLREGERAGR